MLPVDVFLELASVGGAEESLPAHVTLRQYGSRSVSSVCLCGSWMSTSHCSGAWTQERQAVIWPLRQHPPAAMIAHHEALCLCVDLQLAGCGNWNEHELRMHLAFWPMNASVPSIDNGGSSSGWSRQRSLRQLLTHSRPWLPSQPSLGFSFATWRSSAHCRPPATASQCSNQHAHGNSGRHAVSVGGVIATRAQQLHLHLACAPLRRL